MSKRRPPGSMLATLAATLVALGAAPAAVAAPGLYQTVQAEGRYYDDFNNLINSNSGEVFPTGNASSYRFVTCVGSVPGQPGCTVDPGFPEADAWYKLPALPTSAAAQGWTPDYGVNRVRSWSSGTHGVNSGAPGYTAYGASANSGWRDEITTTAAVPITITFVVALHVDWNDGGLWAFQMGRPNDYDPDQGFAEMEGHTWSNCQAQAVSGRCVFNYYTGSALTVLPGGDNGSADLIVTRDFTVYPESFNVPGQPPLVNAFEAVFGARTFANGSEVLGYSTASLQAILVPPGANLSFASGHAYNVQVVPEPATCALWLMGLVGVAAVKRRHVQRASGKDLGR